MTTAGSDREFDVTGIVIGVLLGLVAGVGLLLTIYVVGVVPMLIVFGIVMAIRDRSRRRVVARSAATTMFGGVAIWLVQGIGEPAYLGAIVVFAACAALSTFSARFGCALLAVLYTVFIVVQLARTAMSGGFDSDGLDDIVIYIVWLFPSVFAIVLPRWWWRDRRRAASRASGAHRRT